MSPRGRIRDDDIAAVREKARIEEIIEPYTTLRRSGGDSMKGLCPFHDEKTPSFHVTPSRGLYHCLAGDTRVITAEGTVPIRDLAGRTARVMTDYGKWVDAPFYSFGEQSLMRLTLRRNKRRKTIYATPEHRWFLRNSSGNRGAERTTETLQPGDCLAYAYPQVKVRSHVRPSAYGIARGFTFGDGTVSHNSARALLFGSKDAAMLKWFPLSPSRDYPDQNLTIVSDLPVYWKTDMPPLSESPSYIYGWLAGYFAADGSVMNGPDAVFTSSKGDHLEHVRDLCTAIGIGTFGVARYLRKGFNDVESPIHYLRLMVNDLTEDFFLIDEHRRRYLEKPKKMARKGWVVEAVDTTDRREEVFCAVVPGTHSFVLEDNILTGNCYGCQAGGDVIGFIQEIEGLSFPDAIRHVAGIVGVELREEVTFDPAAEKKSRAYAALEAAAAFFRTQLETPEAAIARQELTSRKFTTEHAADAGCGYAPTDGDLLLTHLRGRGYTDAEMTAAGLARSGRRGVFAFFRGRLLWPIRDARGRVAGFGARRLSDSDPIEGKYVNSPESDVFHKSYLLYGLDQARKAAHRTGRVVIVEGYTDVMAYRAAGVEETVATCGTAFGASHLSVLTRAVGDDTEIVFCFDGDKAGVAAAAKAWAAAKDVLNRTYGVRLPGGADPCDHRMREGDVALAVTLDAKVPLTRMVVDDQIAEILGENPGPEEKSRAAAAVGALLSQVPDEVVRGGYVDHAATVLAVPATSITSGAPAAGKASSDEPPLPSQDASDDDTATAAAPGVGMATGHLLALERRILHRIAADPKTAAAWAATFEPHLFNAPVAQAVCRTILAASSEGVDVAVMTPAAWAGRLLDYGDSATGQAITRLLSEPLPQVTDVATLMRVGKARLEEHLLTVRLDQARAGLAQAAGTPEEDVLLEAVVDLDAQLTALREALDSEHHDT